MICLSLLTIISLFVSSFASTFNASLFVADCGSDDQSINIHYLHPFASSTFQPNNQSINVTFNPSIDQLIFQTSNRLYVADLISNERLNVPLFDWFTGSSNQVFSYNLTSSLITFNWAFVNEIAFQTRLCYIESIDQFWSFNGVNNINEQAASDNYVFSLYSDVLNPSFAGKPIYTLTWNSGSLLIGNADITADPNKKQVYVALYSSEWSGSSSGIILSYDIASGKLLSNVSHGMVMRIKYSNKRQTVFAAQIDDSDDRGNRIVSIEELDPITGKSRVLIDSNNLPQLYGLDLYQAFDDASGEWFFIWQSQIENPPSESSVAFSINLDSQKVAPTVNIEYDYNQVKILGLVIRDNSATTSQPIASSSSVKIQSE